MSLRRHLGHLEAQDLPRLRVHGQGHAQGLTLGVLARFQIIKLDFPQGAISVIGFQKELVSDPLLLSQESDLSDHGFSVEPEHPGDSSLRNARVIESVNDDVESPLFLITIHAPGGSGKIRSAISAKVASDPATF